ncbi:unnamed protein product [Haemonchus placei]|uniref:Uncharacterized protein n=1 Tax=Haemonchus placei TaxID=6290 RepID=A0A3P7VA89_HAEPC|nr:unnamed protein product [Haemonchus placei]
MHSVINETVLTVFNRIVDFVADSSHMIDSFSESHDVSQHLIAREWN